MMRVALVDINAPDHDTSLSAAGTCETRRDVPAAGFKALNLHFT